MFWTGLSGEGTSRTVKQPLEERHDHGMVLGLGGIAAIDGRPLQVEERVGPVSLPARKSACR